MARLIPKIVIDEIGLKPERDVARALVEQLPQDCIVYHSYPWLRADRNDKDGKITLKEGEADFVVVLPELGLLVIEAKGGCIEYDQADHLWHRSSMGGSRKEIRDPFKQARSNTHYLEEQVVRHSFPGEKNIPCGFGYAVVFPDCVYTGPVPPGAESSIVLSANDLPYLGRRIPEILRKWCRRPEPRALSKQELDGILRGLSPSFQLLPVLFRRIEEQEERLFRLTEEQMRVLDYLKKHKRAAIEGVAGSGKTLLAKAQAQRFADQGLKTLLVCYNRVLADWLKGSLPTEYEDRIAVFNFHSLCNMYCRKAGIPFIPDHSESNDFWKHKAPDLFIQAIDRIAERFDAIVVDEGQDFFPDWWLPLEMINREEDAAFYLFYDPAQNLYVGDDLSIPNLGTPITLPTNCRNTAKIAKVCSRIRGIDIPVRNDAPVGDEAIVRFAPSPWEQAEFCQQIVGEWLGQGRLGPSQIVIQSPRARKRCSIADVTKIRNVPITEKLDKWKEGKGVLFSTIRSFKGLEADAVLIVDVHSPRDFSHFSLADFYVACSRAKHLLAVLPLSEGIL
jgi:hypothetical protein